MIDFRYNVVRECIIHRGRAGALAHQREPQESQY
jgi:hypothetical protein